jgi:phenylacetate-CoA ligase
VLTRSGPLDELTVHVERRVDVSAADAETAGRELRGLVKRTIGVSVAVRVLEPNGIERSLGKARRVVDQRPAR